MITDYGGEEKVIEMTISLVGLCLIHSATRRVFRERRTGRFALALFSSSLRGGQ